MEDQKRDFNAQVAGADSGFDGMQTSPVKPQKRSMPLIRYLIYLLIVTMTVTGVSLSRYATSTTTNASPARIAKFDVTVTPSGWIKNGTTAPGKDLTHKDCVMTVENNSEVSVRARLVIFSDSQNAVSSITPSASPSSVIHSAWFNLAIGGTQNVTVSIAGASSGNEVQMYVEYNQVD